MHILMVTFFYERVNSNKFLVIFWRVLLEIQLNQKEGGGKESEAMFYAAKPA